MSDNNSITNLTYEELVLLQEILLKVAIYGKYDEIMEDSDIFESLYRNVMSV